MLDDNGPALLVAELHHRVMNSFQVIFALADRCGRIRDIADLPPMVDDLTRRLSAFADLHGQLARPPRGCFAEYCSTLGSNLVAAFGRSDVVQVTMEPMQLPQDRASRIALIVAELLTNCLKHSLTSQAAGSIRIELAVSDDRLVIQAQDSAAPPISRRPEPSRIVSALSASLGGEARVIDRDGYCAQVSLPFGPQDGRATGPQRNADPVWQGHVRPQPMPFAPPGRRSLALAAAGPTLALEEA